MEIESYVRLQKTYTLSTILTFVEPSIQEEYTFLHHVNLKHRTTYILGHKASLNKYQ